MDNQNFPHFAFIALGSNLNSKFGNPLQTLQAAILDMQQNPKYTKFLKISKISSFIRSKPQQCENFAEDFANAVIKIFTNLNSPFELLKLLQRMEVEFGRTKNQHKNKAEVLYPSRVLDLDILLFDNLKIYSEILTIPHPRMLERDFVMIPLKEIL